MSVNLHLPHFEETVNDPFNGLFENDARLILLWGGRGSGKTHAAVMLIV